MVDCGIFSGKRLRTLLVALALLPAFCFPAQAFQSVLLAWNPDTDPATLGYTLSYGTNSGDYENQIDVGTNTSILVSGLVEGQTNYFVVAAYGAQDVQGIPSSPISYIVPSAGSLQVKLNAAGAQWSVDNGASQNSGAIVSGLSAGPHSVTFSTVSGWITPASQTISIAGNQTNSIFGTYVAVPQTGSLQVTLNVAGAQWAVDKGVLQTSGAVVSGLSVGSHTVTFSAATGWVTPASLTVSVADNQTNSLTANYVAVSQTGSLQVTIAPAQASSAGAQWAVDNGAFQSSGASVTGLSPGAHTVTFSAVNGWTTPASQQITVTSNQTATATGTYVARSLSAAMGGTYNGLFFPADAVTETTSGMLNGLIVKTNGRYSGKILLRGSSLPISGTFDDSGHASEVIARGPRLGGALTLDMTLTWNNSLVGIVGTVSGTNGGPWVANLLADPAATSAQSYQYTLLFPPTTNSLLETPPGFGYATITNHDGKATVAGALADAASFSQHVPVSADGSLPLYVAFGTNELLLGWVTNLYSETPGGAIAWIKGGSVKSVNYKRGFTNLVAVMGSVWTNPAPKQAAIDLANAPLTFFGGGLTEPLDYMVSVATNNTVEESGASSTTSLTGTIERKTGLVQIAFGNGDGKATQRAYGAVLQDSQIAGGYFMTQTNGGAFELRSGLSE
ncbi:MAG TPA: fibronectin type III domain-containing protein [Candidatus Baltobacteraceae bacterium]|jgi:hypothetical protein|nr:fibronectin type III domain-containing protein [Candidatus Baltobacteraceae bacterium]